MEILKDLTKEKIIGTLAQHFAKNDVLMKWLNYGFSTLLPVADYKVFIDTDKIKYKDK